MSLAFWISPEGELIPAKTSHIAAVLSEPSRYGCTREQLLDIHRKYNERIGFEGKARMEIITRYVIPQGWIRVRLYRRRQNEYWSVTLWELDNSSANNLKTFATELLSKSRRSGDRISPSTGIKMEVLSSRTTIEIEKLRDLTTLPAPPNL